MSNIEDMIEELNSLACVVGDKVGIKSESKILEAISTIRELSEKQKWIPIKYHATTDEERELYPYADYIFDCNMPDNDEKILIATKHYGVQSDICYIEDCYCLDSGYDWLDDILAWMPLPEYKGE